MGPGKNCVRKIVDIRADWSVSRSKKAYRSCFSEIRIHFLAQIFLFNYGWEFLTKLLLNMIVKLPLKNHSLIAG